MDVIITIILSSILVLKLIWNYFLMILKIAYYEQTFKNNKHKFSGERYNHIESIMKKKNPFL